MNNQVDNQATNHVDTKFCKHCGGKIPGDAVICTLCGRQVEELKKTNDQPSIVINNNNDNTNLNTNVNKNTIGSVGRIGRPKNKWVALILCLLLGFFGAHKFYEGKFGMGIVYMFTGGLFLIGVVIDVLAILGKPTIYYV